MIIGGIIIIGEIIQKKKGKEKLKKKNLKLNKKNLSYGLFNIFF